MITHAEQQELIFNANGAKGFRLGRCHGCEYVMLKLVEGGEIAAHELPMPVTFYVLRGSGVLVHKGEYFNVHAGALIEVEPGAIRGWKNSSIEELHVLVIKHVGIDHN